MLKQVNNSTFGTEVLAAGGTVVVDVGAEWCPGCRYLKPVIEKMAGEGIPDTAFVEIDADNQDSHEVLRKYDVSSLPTLLVFRGGQLVSKSVGFSGEKQVRELIAGR